MIRRIRFVSVAMSKPKIRAVAAGRQQQRREDLDQRRLARAVGPEQPEELARRDLEVDAVERDHRLRLRRVHAADAGHGDGGRQVWSRACEGHGQPMRTSCGDADATTPDRPIGRWMSYTRVTVVEQGCRVGPGHAGLARPDIVVCRPGVLDRRPSGADGRDPRLRESTARPVAQTESWPTATTIGDHRDVRQRSRHASVQAVPPGDPAIPKAFNKVGSMVTG